MKYTYLIVWTTLMTTVCNSSIFAASTGHPSDRFAHLVATSAVAGGPTAAMSNEQPDTNDYPTASSGAMGGAGALPQEEGMDPKVGSKRKAYEGALVPTEDADCTHKGKHARPVKTVRFNLPPQDEEASGNGKEYRRKLKEHKQKGSPHDALIVYEQPASNASALGGSGQYPQDVAIADNDGVAGAAQLAPRSFQDLGLSIGRSPVSEPNNVQALPLAELGFKPIAEPAGAEPAAEPLKLLYALGGQLGASPTDDAEGDAELGALMEKMVL